MDRPAAHAEQLADGRIRCRLCPHSCVIEPAGVGDCLTRRHDGSRLIAETYGRLQAAAVDPIEKKPLNHYRPGTQTFSIAASGCNLVCPFCQNHGLSQCLRDIDPAGGRVGRRWSPEEVVRAALDRECESISFTYSEPILSFEFALDVAEAAAQSGLEIVFVTNGQARRAVAQELAGFLAAANVDLKCFSARRYREVLGGSLRATTGTIETLVERGVWVELTTLVIPDFNDGDDHLTAIAEYIAAVGVDIPWHVSRFHGAYRWSDRPATPVATLERAREIGAAAGLRHVYSGNLPGDDGEKTRCPGCGAVLIDRVGYRTGAVETTDGCCWACGEAIAGVGFP